MAKRSNRKSVLQLVSQFEDITMQHVVKLNKKASFISYMDTSDKKQNISEKSSNKRSSDNIKTENCNEVLSEIISGFDQLSEKIDIDSSTNNKIVDSSKHVNISDKPDRIVKVKTKCLIDLEDRAKQRSEKLKHLENISLRRKDKIEVDDALKQTDKSIEKTHSDKHRYHRCESYSLSNENIEEVTVKNDLYQSLSTVSIEDYKNQSRELTTEENDLLQSSSNQLKYHHYENYQLPNQNTVCTNNNNEMCCENDQASSTEHSSHRTSSSSQSSGGNGFDNPLYQYLNLKHQQNQPHNRDRTISENSAFSNNEEMNSDYVTITTYEPVVHGNMPNKKRASDELHYKTLITIFPDVDKSQTEISKVKLSLDKVGEEEVQKYKDIKEYIVDELISTEENYIKTLQLAINKYQEPLKSIIGETDTFAIFNVLENILKGTSAMITKLERVRLDYEALGQVFLNNMKILEIYPAYCAKQKKATEVCKKHETLIKSIEVTIGDKFGLANHLMKPIIRLAKYEQLLNKLQKQLQRDGLPNINITAAGNLIHNIAVQSDNLVEPEFQRNTMHQSSDRGKYIMGNSFRLLSPKKCTVVLFLFQHAIVITKKDKNVKENHIVYETIHMNTLGPPEDLDHQTAFTLTRRAKGKIHSFRVEARTADIKQAWLKVLKCFLWKQFDEAKSKNQQLFESK